MTARLVPVNERGNPLGDHHHRCTIPDAVVKELRDLHEFQGFGPRRLAIQFALSEPTVKAIVYYVRRNVTPADYKRIED